MPAPGQSLLLVQDMACRLSLGPDPRAEAVKPGQRSGRRKEKPGRRPDRSGAASEEPLDSGLGSIDGSLTPVLSCQNPAAAACGCCCTPVLPRYQIGPGSDPYAAACRPLSAPTYTPPGAACQLQMFWSDPFCGHRRDLGPGAHLGPGPGAEERRVVRKKLLAIFSAALVDAAMERFPHVLDPQRLVAEILTLQAQGQR